MRELGHLLRELEPPPGGLQRLQRALDAPARRHPHRVRLMATGCAVLLVALTAWQLPTLLTNQQRTATLLGAMQQAIKPGPDGIHVKNGSALELPSGQPDARVYLVQTGTP
jgi:ferric-dicitrate binding protein FerR (iron transport regulator)